MAKIVYGVSGEGSGHSSRARVIAAHLLRSGHSVKVVSYDRGVRNLRDDFDVFEIEGLHISSRDNRVSKVRTLTENLRKLTQGHRKLTSLRREVFKAIRPDCVFTDFEPMTAYLANHYGLPLISVDNQHRLRYMRYPCPPRLRQDKSLTRNIIRAMVPAPDVALVTTFFYGTPKNAYTFLFPPILRQVVLELTPVRGDHILVYLTGGFESFVSRLADFRRERFVIYGYDRDEQVGNLRYKPFSKDGFLNDLAGCKAVMATAGFTLSTEALYLRKPYLAMPMNGQFEQEINAHFLDRLGYGKSILRPTGTAIGDFLYRIPDYVDRLKDYQAEGNRKILRKVDALLADNCALARQFHTQRSGYAPSDGLPSC
jgi:uncharacterized protein (TIGR00661 family)